MNARSVGGFTTSTEYDIVKPVVLFRSADPSRITPKGKEQLLALGVRRVFDFRADDEIASYNSTTPIIPGVEFLRAPVSQSRAFDPASLAVRWVPPEHFSNPQIYSSDGIITSMKEFAGNELEVPITFFFESPCNLEINMQ